MNIFKIVIYTIFSFVIFIACVKAEDIRIDTKLIGNDVIFVFHHTKEQVVDLRYKNGKVFADFNIPVNYKITSKDFNKYGSNIQIGANRQSLSFSVNKSLKYNTIIDGESFEAIKFKAVNQNPDEDTIPSNLQNISKENNSPKAVEYTKRKDLHTLQFNLVAPNSKFAAFKKNGFLWIAFNTKQLFTFEEEGIFQEFMPIQSNNGTLLRLKVKDGYNYSKINHTAKGWSITFSNKKIIDKAASMLTKPSENNSGFTISGNFLHHEIIEFEDSNLGEKFVIVPIEQNRKVSQTVSTPEFKIFESLQGVAISTISDEVDIELYEDALKIVVEHNEDMQEQQNEKASDTLADSALMKEYLRLPTLLPVLNKNLQILDFNLQRSTLTADAAMSTTNQDAVLKNLTLAKFYFMNEFYHEALGVLNHIASAYPKEYQGNFEARFLTGVTYTLCGEYDSATNYYDELLKYQDLKQLEELNLWNRFNNLSLGSSTDDIGVINNLSTFLKFYSDDKYWPIVLTEIESSIKKNNLKLTERIFKEVRSSPEGSYTNSLKYFKAMYYKKKNQTSLAKQFLQDISVNTTDIFNSVRAEFELIKMKLEENEMSSADAAQKLSILQYKWRGDQLEYEILMYLAKLYRSNNDVVNAMRTFQYVQDSFNNKVSNFYITSEMAKIFNNVFLPGGYIENMDDFTAVALFYEFKELNPIGEKGDNVILSIAKRLVKLDLLENAIDLLRHQVKYRLKNEKKVAIADNLAIILMMDKKPREAQLILDDTDLDNFDFEEHK
jgi:Flp pilus assembly protein TadD